MLKKVAGNIYDPNNLVKHDSDWDYRGLKDYVRYVKVDEFHIGQNYEDRPVERMECIHCNGTHFMVGQGSYYTAIKCPVCLWELQIHEG